MAAIKVTASSGGGGGHVLQNIQFVNSADGVWPTTVRLRGCSRPFAVTGCGSGSAGCDGYSLSAMAVSDAAVPAVVALFDPSALDYHCREAVVSNPAGIQSIQVSASFQGTGGGAAAFDDFDLTVTEPRCWGELSYCRSVRDSLGPVADSCLFTAAETEVGNCIKTIVDDARWTKGFGATEAAALGGVIQDMLGWTDADSCSSDNLPGQLRPKFALRSRTIDSQPCCVLAESGTYRFSGAGVAMVRIGTPDQYRPVHLHAPHPRTDTNTEVQAFELFRQTMAHSVVIAGARRDAAGVASSCQSSYGASDSAHNTDSLTWVAALAVARHYASSPAQVSSPWTVLEPHGMGASTCPGVDVFLTAGKDTASDGNAALARLNSFRVELAAALPLLTVATPVGDGTGCNLMGSTNTAGRALNGVAEPEACSTSAAVADVKGRFMHIEQKYALRTTDSHIAAIAAAMRATWPTG